MQKREYKGNIRKYYLKALRALLNKAIQEKEAFSFIDATLLTKQNIMRYNGGLVV